MIATNFKDKIQVLKDHFFLSLSVADLENITTTQYLMPLQSLKVVTPEKVQAAIYRPNSDKAPSINRFPNWFLKLILEVFLPYFTHLFQACIDLGYHPEEFWIANTKVLKKPKRGDYTLAESYRPIALLNILGKALEAILACCLSKLAEAKNLLPSQQMGAQKGRSIKTALKILIESIYTVWDCNRKNVTSVLSLDMTRAFDHVSYPWLLHNLQTKGIPEYIIRWIKNFLKRRSTSMTVGKKTSKVFSIGTGIPQGLPISPILFLFFNMPLIENCAKSELRVQVRGFADDVHLIAYNSSTESNCHMLEKAHTLCLEWAQKYEASFASKKYKLLHLTCSPKKFNITAIVDLGKHRITPKAQLKVLSLWIDGKLR